MRLARFNEGRIGVIEGNEIADITGPAGCDPVAWPPVGMVSLIGRHGDDPDAIAEMVRSAPRLPLAEVRLDCPIDWPNKVVAFPANYDAHIAEQRRTKVGLISTFDAAGQGFFLKSNSSLSGPEDPIILPPIEGREIHHECEMAIIIGRGGRGITRAEAYDHIFGYACLVDVVVRGREERVMRKSYDSFCPLGPTIVTADEIADPNDLDLRLTVNGDVRQEANTHDLKVDIPGMVEMASAVMTLFPGDVIATGTPAGVGPIQPGDRLVSSVSGLGELALEVLAGDLGAHPVWNKPEN
ncbi:fumarylacetoacetate hydrolase family protein [Oceanicola sp. 502str15]|uniref:fumarylacetoacetate hydrolase family protein n=1 Tax=Oceanicola sp. 502str15 TaxID=2696061 RepID=UPI0020958E40|nr:fumarylacetoacetate hydrolase family protein [Oceanicola sp. 502str15]MCO6385286.1 FAA hydrolase family protein [Oceanicola sp. 502str15]